MRCGVSPTSSGQIGRGFGTARGRTTGVARLHAGMDFVAARNEKVRAPWAGTCVLVGADDVRRGPLDGYGNAVVVHSPDLGVYWLFAHLAGRPWVTVGERVEAGRVVGQVGSSNNGKFAGMGAHLHLETSTIPWPKGYGRSSIDPAGVFERIGLVVERPARARPRLVNGDSCDFLPLRGLPALGRYLAEGPDAGEGYEPPDEAFEEGYELSPVAEALPSVLVGVGLAVGALLVAGLLTRGGR
jgi:murein DD-endopeptidase MepM/ murein hydrolase activator NlpD